MCGILSSVLQTFFQDWLLVKKSTSIDPETPEKAIISVFKSYLVHFGSFKRHILYFCASIVEKIRSHWGEVHEAMFVVVSIPTCTNGSNEADLRHDFRMSATIYSLAWLESEGEDPAIFCCTGSRVRLKESIKHETFSQAFDLWLRSVVVFYQKVLRTGRAIFSDVVHMEYPLYFCCMSVSV